MKKLLSIIIPVYPDINELTGLVKKLYSLDKEKECEIIIINDGCRDEIEEDILMLDNVKYYNNLENKGRSYSRNVGIDNATGDYITFIDADDFVEDSFLKDIKNKLHTNLDLYIYRINSVGSHIMPFYCNGKINIENINETIVVDDLYIRNFLKFLGMSSIGGKVFKRKLIEYNNIKFKENLNYAEDLVFIVEFMDVINNAMHCSEIFYNYNYINNKYERSNIIDNFVNITKLDIFKKYENEFCYFLTANLSFRIHSSDLLKYKNISNFINYIYENSIEDENIYYRFRHALSVIFNKVKVSIIIPVYNVEKYIEKCLKSAVNQTYKNLEIIIINDGTKDNSMDIVEKYKDDRFVIINQENKGLSAARNVGLDIATGDYIFFLDSDDWIDDDYIEEMISIMNEDDYDSICNVNHILYFSNYIKSDISYTIEQDKVITYPKCGEFYNPYGICFFMFKRDFLNKYGIRFIEGSNNEDVGFQALCAPFIRKCLFFGGNYNYNVIKRPDSITANYGKNFQIEVCDQFDGVVQFYKNHKLDYPLPYFLIVGFLLSYEFDNEKQVLEKLINVMKKHNLLEDLKQFPKELLERNSINIY